MGRNFDDYPGFHKKKSPQVYETHCIYSIFLFFSRIMYSMRPNVEQSFDKSVAGLSSSTRRALYILTLNLSILSFMPEIQTMTSGSSILDWLEPYWDLRES